jgi:hypothetical protein
MLLVHLIYHSSSDDDRGIGTSLTGLNSDREHSRSLDISVDLWLLSLLAILALAVIE